ncbi:unnamed protein product, partial [Urochloa humidicola]
DIGIKHAKYIYLSGTFGLHHCNGLVETIEMDIWITQFGVRTRKLRVPEVAGKTCRPVGLGGPPKAPKLCTMA